MKKLAKFKIGDYVIFWRSFVGRVSKYTGYAGMCGKYLNIERIGSDSLSVVPEADVMPAPAWFTDDHWIEYILSDKNTIEQKELD
jgi:hypothetical protein